MELTDTDAATVAHIAGNVAAYRQQLVNLDPASAVWASTWAGILAGNVDSLLKVIERLTRPQLTTCLQSWPDHKQDVRRCQLPAGHPGLHKDGTSHASADYVGRHRMAGE